MPNKGGKCYKILKKKKNQSVTHVSRRIFQGLFKNIILRPVALVKKKLWAILDFFLTDRTFYGPVLLKRKTIKFLFIKSHKMSW